jgi:xylulokinase
VSSPRAGWSETDPQAWWSSTTAAVRTAVAQAKANVLAIGLSGQMHGIVAADGTGAPVRPAMLWSDARATDELWSYEDLPAHVRARLADPLSPGMAGPLLSWVRRHEPEVYAATRWALSPKDWLRSRLTGEFHTEPSDASATLLYDVVDDGWDLQVLDALGLDPGKLAPVLPGSAHPAGHLTSAAAELPVAAGAADTAAAALSSALVDPATAQLTIGTGAQVIRPVAVLPGDLAPDPVTHLYRSAAESGWYRMAASLNGGSMLSRVRGVLGASWQEMYDCAARPADPDAPLFLPHIHGERTPYLDPRMRGARTGLAPRHGREELLHAALEGVAFAVRNATDCLLSSGPQVPSCGSPAAARPLLPGGKCSRTSSSDPSGRSRRFQGSARPFSPAVRRGCPTPRRTGGPTGRGRRHTRAPNDPAPLRTATAPTASTSQRCGRRHRRSSPCPRRRPLPTAFEVADAPSHSSPTPPVPHQTSGANMRPTTGPPVRRAGTPGAGTEAVERP